MMMTASYPQTPAQAGVQGTPFRRGASLDVAPWVPAFAGTGGNKTRPSFASQEQSEGAAAAGQGQQIAASPMQKKP